MPTLELIRPITGKNGVTLDAGTIRDFPDREANLLIERGFGRSVGTTLSRPEPDPVLFVERIGLRFGNETPEVLGDPLIVQGGIPLAWSGDLPHIRFFAWALLHLWPDFSTALNRKRAKENCRLTDRDLDRSISDLVRLGDLIRDRVGRGECYRLAIRYV